jgi:hypothetical protein
MRVFTRPRFWRTLRYRLSVAGICLAYLLVALDIPLPASVHKDASEPFPCQNHPCGCQTAEQCWRHCCCFTAEERWAWARAHGVEPPAYAEKPSEGRAATVRERECCRSLTVAAHPSPAGWNTAKLRDRATQNTEQAAKSCCRTSAKRSACCQTTSDHPAKQPPAKSGRVRWGTVLAAWQCQGGTTLWVSVGAVLPVFPPPEWHPDWPPPSHLALTNAIACSVPRTPLAPPPRLSLG